MADIFVTGRREKAAMQISLLLTQEIVKMFAIVLMG